MTHIAPSIGLSERLLLGYARRFPLRKGKMRAVDTLWRPAIGNGTPLRTADLNFGGFRMPVDLSERLQRQFYFFGTYYLEDSILACWSQIARSSKIVFDVGANAGIYSLAALAAAPDACVHAFEPTPEIAQHLRETAALNGLSGLQVQEMAASDHSGTAKLVRFRGDDGANGGMNYLSQSNVSGATELQVETVRLDEFCAARVIRQIDLLKIDVQGHEPAVLAGAGRLLEEGCFRTIFVELNWERGGDQKGPAAKTVERLATAGYWFAEPRLPLRWRPAGDWLEAHSDIVAAIDPKGRE